MGPFDNTVDREVHHQALAATMQWLVYGNQPCTGRTAFLSPDRCVQPVLLSMIRFMTTTLNLQTVAHARITEQKAYMEDRIGWGLRHRAFSVLAGMSCTAWATMATRSITLTRLGYQLLVRIGRNPNPPLRLYALAEQAEASVFGEGFEDHPGALVFYHQADVSHQRDELLMVEIPT